MHIILVALVVLIAADRADAQELATARLEGQTALASLVAELEQRNPELAAARRDIDMRVADPGRSTRARIPALARNSRASPSPVEAKYGCPNGSTYSGTSAPRCRPAASRSVSGTTATTNPCVSIRALRVCG